MPNLDKQSGRRAPTPTPKRAWFSGARRSLLAALALGLFFCASCRAAADAPTLRFVYENYPPYEYEEQGRSVGIHVSILREVCARLGITAQFAPLPWLRALHVAENGEVDGVFSLFKTPERERFLIFPDQPLSLETNVLLTSTERPVTVKSRADLRGKSVGVVAGNAYGRWFDHADWIDKQPVTGSDRLLLKQAAKRTDLSVSNAWVARYLIDQLGLQDRVTVLDFVVSEEPLYIAFPRAKGSQSVDLARQFSKTLKAMQAEGRIAAIVYEHTLRRNSTP